MTPDFKETNIFSPETLQKVIDYMEENLLKELTPGIIASHFFVNVSSLSVLFKTVCQMTMMEYIRNRRLTLAAQELSTSNTPVIELAYKYGYETPEAFTKAFSRFHGFPLSFVRRGFQTTNRFLPLQVRVELRGGWNRDDLTKSYCQGQDQPLLPYYNTFIPNKGGKRMEVQKISYQINTENMHFQTEWDLLCSLTEHLLRENIPFKVDGKTMIFAHGLEFPLEKICLTFKWKDEEIVRNFFHYDRPARLTNHDFKFFDVPYRGMKIRCMFYGGSPNPDSDAFLYRNTDLVRINRLTVPVQSLAFYYENAQKDSVYYKMVEQWIGSHKNYRIQNKKAWEYSAYDFWVKTSGTPAERAKKDRENPLGMLRRYTDYFDRYENVRIANICGSCGKKAIPLAILGAEVTVFDISVDNQKYALETAKAAKTSIDYEVCDILEINTDKYGNYFDVVFMEGGILHYFHDIDEFMSIMYTLLKQDGKMICSDFHPFTKISDILHFEQPAMDYFSAEVFEGEMAHARFYEDEVRKRMPKCLYRKYTVSEIINAVINCGFLLEKFDEHPAWTNEKVPGEFTVVASKKLSGNSL